MNEKALKYGKMACRTMMRKFAPEQLPPQGAFHYHQGVFLSGMLHIYDVCGEESCFQYVKDWVDSIIPEPGVIHWYTKGSLDDYQPGILLFPLYERTKDEKYRAALDMQAANLRNWRRNSCGGFWHKERYSNQMWLDGLYMAGPVQMMYARAFGAGYLRDQAIEQAFLMYENMRDPKTGLMYHAWDPSFVAPWADKETGLSPEFWGRALGWYVVAVLDILENLDPEDARYARLAQIEKSVLSAVLRYQADNGTWHQVVDKGADENNWQESSCSCLFTYAAAKAWRMGILGQEAKEAAKRGFEGVVRAFISLEGDELTMSGICIGTGVLQYQGYLSRPTSQNDLHGMGAFLLMCGEIAKLKD